MIQKKYKLLLALSMLTIVSCTDTYLDTVPTDSIAEDAALSTPENMALVLNGLHRQMYAQSTLTGATNSRSGESHFIPALDAVGGNIIHSIFIVVVIVIVVFSLCFLLSVKWKLNLGKTSGWNASSCRTFRHCFYK